jgi:hypothetical protein
MACWADIHQAQGPCGSNWFIHMETVFAAGTFKFAATVGKFHFIDFTGQLAGGTFNFHISDRSPFLKDANHNIRKNRKGKYFWVDSALPLESARDGNLKETRKNHR